MERIFGDRIFYCVFDHVVCDARKCSAQATTHRWRKYPKYVFECYRITEKYSIVDLYENAWMEVSRPPPQRSHYCLRAARPNMRLRKTEKDEVIGAPRLQILDQSDSVRELLSVKSR